MNRDRTHIDISIPFDLARYATCQRKLINKYHTNQVIKALDTWLVLKHETTAGIIQSWNDQKQWLFTICKCSESIFRHRLKVLADLNILTVTAGSIHVCSWETFAKRLSIDISKKLTIKYPIYEKQRLQEWIVATEIQDNKNRQDYTIMMKLNKNPECKMVVTAALIAAGADRSKLESATYFLNWMRIAYLNDFVQVSDIHDILIEFRPDNNRSVRGMADAWNCKHPMTVSYWKKVLKKNMIIDIASLQVESTDRVRNKHCKVVWLKETKQTLLCLCDQIDLLKPWEIIDMLKSAAA